MVEEAPIQSLNVHVAREEEQTIFVKVSLVPETGMP